MALGSAGRTTKMVVVTVLLSKEETMLVVSVMMKLELERRTL